MTAGRVGTDERPLIRLAGIDDPGALRGETMLIEDELADDEWLAGDLASCTVVGMGPVTQVVDGPSCSLLELDDGWYRNGRKAAAAIVRQASEDHATRMRD